MFMVNVSGYVPVSMLIRCMKLKSLMLHMIMSPSSIYMYHETVRCLGVYGSRGFMLCMSVRLVSCDK